MVVDTGMNITIADVRRHAQERVDIIQFTTLHTVDTHHQIVQVEVHVVATAHNAGAWVATNVFLTDAETSLAVTTRMTQ
jgi:hypothetical protein